MVDHVHIASLFRPSTR